MGENIDNIEQRTYARIYKEFLQKEKKQSHF